MANNLHIALLHEDMVDKNGKVVTTSLTLNDIQDLARTAKTYGIKSLYIVHPSPALRKLAHRLKVHWNEGFGASYNPCRRTAMELIEIAASLDEVLLKIETGEGMLPKLVATSARDGGERLSFSSFREKLAFSGEHFLLMLGTGWGMSEKLLKRADYFLEPIKTNSGYNHLSVRAACAVMLDRLLS